MSLIELDGSFGEGGGQILRTSLALSLITGRGFHLSNVRAGRAKPGLQPQHLTSVRAAARVGRAALRGASPGSTDLVFEPGPVTPGTYRFEIGTAGATGLVLQTVYLPLALRAAVPNTFTLIGGTHVRTSPSFHFLDEIWRRYLGLSGLSVRLNLVRPGFYPRGGRTLEAFLQPCPLIRCQSLLERGEPRVSGFSAVAGLPESIARRQARRAAFRLAQRNYDAIFREEVWEGGPCTVLAVRVDAGPVPALFVSVGERGKPAERVADEAVDEALSYLTSGPSPVDSHSADQILLPLALAEGSSEYRVAAVTRHLTTNATVVRRFLDRDIVVEGDERAQGLVRVS